MSQSEIDTHAEIRQEVRKLCARFPGEYWRERDRERTYPTAFVQALTEAGFTDFVLLELEDETGGNVLTMMEMRRWT